MQNFITTTLKLGRKVSLVLWLIDQYTSHEGLSEKYDYVLEVKDGQVYQHNSQEYFNMEAMAI